MISVGRIYKRAKKIVGSCSDETLFDLLNDAVELLANSGDFDPLIGIVDITAEEDSNHQVVVTLPREVEMVLGVNISKQPTIGRDRLFNFHINGPGDSECGDCCKWGWWKQGEMVPLFRDIDPAVPMQLTVVLDHADDAAATVWVEGYDLNDKWVRTRLSAANWTDGSLLVNSTSEATLPGGSAVFFKRVTRVRKSITNASLRIFGFASGALTGTALGEYRWDDEEPRFRRLTIDRESDEVRVSFRRRVFEIQHQTDLIPLHSALAVLEALRAVWAYEEDDVVLGAQHESTARRLLTEKEESIAPPVTQQIQMDPRNLLHDKSDCVD